MKISKTLTERKTEEKSEDSAGSDKKSDDKSRRTKTARKEQSISKGTPLHPISRACPAFLGTLKANR